MNRAGFGVGLGGGYSACRAADVEGEVYERLYLDGKGRYYLPPAVLVVAMSKAASRCGLRGKGKRKAKATWPIELQDALQFTGLTVGECRFSCGRRPRRIESATTFAAGSSATWTYPVFDDWSVAFRLGVEAPRYDLYTVRCVLATAGRRIGLPQFTPFIEGGEWGRFIVSKWEEL